MEAIKIACTDLDKIIADSRAAYKTAGSPAEKDKILQQFCEDCSVPVGTLNDLSILLELLK